MQCSTGQYLPTIHPSSAKVSFNFTIDASSISFPHSLTSRSRDLELSTHLSRVFVRREIIDKVDGPSAAPTRSAWSWRSLRAREPQTEPARAADVTRRTAQTQRIEVFPLHFTRPSHARRPLTTQFPTYSHYRRATGRPSDCVLFCPRITPRLITFDFAIAPQPQRTETNESTRTQVRYGTRRSRDSTVP